MRVSQPVRVLISARHPSTALDRRCSILSPLLTAVGCDTYMSLRSWAGRADITDLVACIPYQSTSWTTKDFWVRDPPETVKRPVPRKCLPRNNTTVYLKVSFSDYNGISNTGELWNKRSVTGDTPSCSQCARGHPMLCCLHYVVRSTTVPALPFSRQLGHLESAVVAELLGGTEHDHLVSFTATLSASTEQPRRVKR